MHWCHLLALLEKVSSITDGTKGCNSYRGDYVTRPHHLPYDPAIWLLEIYLEDRPPTIQTSKLFNASYL